MSSQRIIAESRRRYWKVYLTIAVAALLLFAVLYNLNVLEYSSTIAQEYSSWPVDGLFALLLTAAFASIAVLAVHERQLQREVAQRRQAEDLAQTAFRYDSLTGISNRVLFQEEFSRALSQARSNETRLAVLVIDIDEFQQVNDAHGHDVGDAVLTTLAGRLRGIVRKEDVLARLGADEFAILFPMRNESTEALFRLAERILQAAHDDIEAPNRNLRVSASIGIAKFPRDGDAEAGLLRCAEAALVQAKATGKDRYSLYDSSLDARRRERLETEAELRAGLERGEIIALYQPLVDLDTQRTVGFEALARWRHPVRGLLGAPDFIPIIEDAGLAGPLLQAMLRRVCDDSRHWPAGVRVAVNLSPPQLLDPELPDSILDLLRQMGVEPCRIELEITETALLQDFEAARRAMSVLREAGVHMSLDDFGTGYSSLRHLHELPIDKIKIDRSFTSRLSSDAQCRKIVASMLSLSEALGLTTVAEGVELPQQAEWLRTHGCTLGQGYLFARPLPPTDAFGTVRDQAG
ncbi:putative bifunctional diguanylate cyclase/phosphodiesterase [Xanthobacter variabilis]|uniref:putative bifunctional diguanylate cyclase/phosphodiesterase n=1 Tax=Xanthobacter variabilis TaxID=3119932 RepID=UPI00374F5B81